MINTAASMDGLTQFASTVINDEIFVFGRLELIIPVLHNFQVECTSNFMVT